MNVSLRQLKAFVLAAHASSFSSAADRLGITQPGFSVLMRSLEETFGLQLFVRTTRKIELTVAGRAMLPSVERALKQVEEACQQAEALREGRTGTLHLAVVPSVAGSLLPEVLTAVRTVLPGVAIVIQEDHAAAFTERISSGEAEIGLGPLLAKRADVTFEPLLRDHLVVIVHEDHPLAQLKTIDWQALTRHDYISSMTTQWSVRHYAERAAASVGVYIEPRYSIASINAALGLTRARFGYSLLPSLALASLQLDGLVVRPVRRPSVRRQIGLLSRSGQPLSPAAAAFQATARRVLQQGRRQRGAVAGPR
ncbi:MAG: LysR family transcriptional regulator [Burkholderiaceae bacterium]